MLTAKEIRESYKDFFRSKGHTIVPSAPMVIKDDPTLMFTNAGMNQFKDIILGNKAAKHTRVADSQKCLRVSGKHNDLEEVGMDTYHHTMFEMLGNWSFGDYFKKEAIDWAWEYLVDVLGLDPANLYATVFEGSAEEGLSRDDEAASYWEKHLPADHIINGNKHDNFWEMGDTGPCGPCSEIHIDLRSDEEKAAIPGRDLVNHDHPQVIEIWNLVFMQYNRKADGTLEPLPAKVIDTGMGFERLCMALQGKKSNYDTDVFTPLIDKIGQLAGMEYGKDAKVDIAMRVIADHVRTIAFSIADSQLPGNAKAGYVIRRILRRAVRYAYTFLGQKQAFMYRLVDTLIESMGEAYPELPKQRELIMRVIKEEEDAFLRTLENGIRLLDNAIEQARAKGSTEISGKEAFQLYDTYGFPLDLTELILKENDMTLDHSGFDTEMAAQKARARNAAAVETGDWVIVNEGEQQFVGYDCTDIDAYILRYRKITQKNKEYYQIIFDRTPFYGEMGGQVGDRGVMKYLDGETIDIFDTKRENGVTVHLTKELTTENYIQSAVRLIVDEEARQATSCNHTATHLLHEALREVLGSHVEQRGSYVSPEVLRFDFSHFQKLTPEEIEKVEKLANKAVRRAIPRDEHRCVPIDKAREMGAMALFGEKYGDEVRVIRYGSSIEFCGGTHVENTGNIGMIKIISESSIAAGIRRIEAITGERVEEAINNVNNTMKEISAMFNNAPNLIQTLRKSIDENAELRRQAEEYFTERINNLTDKLLSSARVINGTKVVELTGIRLPEVAKGVAFAVRAKSPEHTVFIGTTVDPSGKPLLTVMITDDLVKDGLNASATVREAAKQIQGGGGGQPGFAQAGGKNKDGITSAYEKIKEILSL
ncbi:alanine--tRNA ligase [Muribaculum intestinale]|uniref:alanine--tRNA ligase n=4 Tax=Muribaculum intestinale TaxID=1796646 RepID=UPI000F4AD2BA|nr:alanine--tRNA ligase [Muribaculum intestinale]ROT02984.1 alanine--tRNA ligase [Muribaculaceae bacterium Isolate-100 (HZI)]RXE63859.1 alanine--tRNA ligase [Muribaculaceae bacterium Isolate-007 (NCI)]